ncbi:MAG: GntP family permease, partial [Planctomycetota bacterium]|nr:GntP family permease [Planctomycetota bacterium]
MGQYLVVLVIAIALLVYMVIKLKIHPALALFICGMLAGVCFGYGVAKTAGVFTGGFGGTLGGIGCTIIFGSIIASGIQDTGSIKSMVNFFIRLFKGKCLELSTSLAGFVMSIPVFGDITQVLIAPIASLIGKRKKISMSQMGAWAGVGASLTHAVVPPTPGILAITIMFGADLGLTIFWGTVISFVSLILT